MILKEKGLSFDEQAFEKALQQQKDRSRSAAQVATGDWITILATAKEEFIGYDYTEAEVSLSRYRKIVNKKDGELYQIVLDKTPFYPEGGGQVGDKGCLKEANGNVIYIIDTKKENNVIIHFARTLPEHLDQSVTAVVDTKQRLHSAANHSATHLLHQALRSILGTHVEQKGSLVHSSYLRFDFAHYAKVTSDDLQAVEQFVNTRIQENLPLEEQRNLTYEQAVKEGAIALFGEKYGDTVRTIRFGESMELCGGIHVPQTGDIWHFKITSESAVAAGIRRIEAITNNAAKNYFSEQTKAFDKLKFALKNPKDPLKTLIALQDENAALKKEVTQLLKAKAKNLKGELINKIREVNGIQFLATAVDLDAAGIKDLAFELGKVSNNMFLLFGTEQNGKALLSCYISKELVKSNNLNAGTVVRELGKHIQGGGGGQPFFATAGGKNPEGIAKALDEAESYITSS